jgi:hypothetical protein
MKAASPVQICYWLAISQYRENLYRCLFITYTYREEQSDYLQHSILHNESMIPSHYDFVESIVAAVNTASFPNDEISMCLHHYE